MNQGQWAGGRSGSQANLESRSKRAPKGRISDWRRQLERLKQSLIATAQLVSGERYQHAILWIDGDLPDRIAEVIPRVHAHGYRVHRIIPVPLPHGHHVHFILDDNLEVGGDDDLKLFLDVLRDSRRILHAVPKRLLPTFAVPPAGDGLTESLLTWLYLLHWLGNDPDNTVFRSLLEFTNDKSGFSSWSKFTEWKRCSTLPDFDPVQFLTLTHAGEKGIDSWREEHRSAGKPLPEVIACSLSKPLWYASVNAIDLILRQDQSVRASTKTNSKTTINDGRNPANLRREKDLAELYNVTLGHLLKHKGDPLVKPLTWKGLQARLPQGLEQWSQSKISRVMAELLNADRDKGMTAYKTALVSDNPLSGFLQYDPERRRIADASVDPKPMFDEDAEEA